MTDTAFAHRWRGAVDQTIVTDPTYGADLTAIRDRLNDPNAPRTALDELITPSHDHYDRYDAAALHEVGLLLNLGWVVISRITPTTHDPHRQSTPGSRLPDPFTIHPTTNTGAFSLNWNNEICVEHTALTEHPIIVAYDPAGVPLSIGPCEPATVIHALRRLGGIARWPNQNDPVILLLTTCNITGQTEPVGNPRILAGSWVAEPPTGWSA